MKIELANERLGRFVSTKKRVKILVGGRGSTKSTAVADYVAACVSHGQLWCCAREFQNSINESVHRLILDEIERIGLEGFSETNTSIEHISGGRIFYLGLARNSSSIKSMLSGVDGLWIEEGASISHKTLNVLTASLRLSAKDAEKAIKGEAVKQPEIIISMNRESRQDAIAQRYLAKAEPSLERCGYYEDDEMLAIQINYSDIPKSWWDASGLEVERAVDEKVMSQAQYRHKWGGHYLESVDNALIQPEWFDAAIDAHKKLGIEPAGATVVTHDPADTGDDAMGYAARKGIHFFDVCEISADNGNEAARIAASRAINARVDLFVWDADGMGALLREQIAKSFAGVTCEVRAYKGSGEVEDKKAVYNGLGSLGGKDKPKTNADTFFNKRAQYYTKLAQRFLNTYLAVIKGEYIDPDSLISIDSNIKLIDKLRAEVCRIPLKHNGAGKIQLMSKQEMLTQGIQSPNMADCLAMAMEQPAPMREFKPIEFVGWE